MPSISARKVVEQRHHHPYDDASHLKSMSVSGLRGFKSEQTVYFSLPSRRHGSGYTVIVGENNSGKSTIVECLGRITPRDQEPLKSTEKRPNSVALIKFRNCHNEVKEYEFWKNGRGYFATEPYVFPHAEQLIVVSHERNWTSNFDAWLDDVSGYEIYDLEREITSRFKHEFGTPFQEVFDQNFGFILASISKNEKDKKRLNAYVRLIIPDFNDWTVVKFQKRYRFKYIARDRTQHATDLLGSGVLNIMKIMVAFLLEKDIVVIDEPERGLHPQAQKRLCNFLVEKSSEHQIVVTSHSPYFIDWNSLKNLSGLSRTRKNDIGENEIFNLGMERDHFLRTLTENWQKPEELDNVAKELFFANNVVFLEGKEDVSLISRFISDSKIKINFEFLAYGSRGATMIKDFLSLASELGIRSGAVFDSDVETGAKEYTICKSAFPASLVQIISTDDIRDKAGKFNSKGERIGHRNGLFDIHGNIKSEHVAEIRNIILRFVSFFDDKDIKSSQ